MSHPKQAVDFGYMSGDTSKMPAPDFPWNGPVPTVPPPDWGTVAYLQARIVELQREIIGLHEQLAKQSELRNWFKTAEEAQAESEKMGLPVTAAAASCGMGVSTRSR